MSKDMSPTAIKSRIFKHFDDLAETISEELINHTKHLSHQITDISTKRGAFFIQGMDNNMSEIKFYTLALGLGSIRKRLYSDFRHHAKLEPDSESAVIYLLLTDLIEWFEKVEKRYKRTKFYKFFFTYYRNPSELYFQRFKFNTEDFYFWPPAREFKAIYRHIYSHQHRVEWLKSCFTILQPTTRTVKRAAFIRGYRDHGYRASVDERARRKANEEFITELSYQTAKRQWSRYKKNLRTTSLLRELQLNEIRKILKLDT